MGVGGRRDAALVRGRVRADDDRELLDLHDGTRKPVSSSSMATPRASRLTFYTQADIRPYTLG